MIQFLSLYLLIIISLVCYAWSFRYLIRYMGEYGGYEINSIGGIILFAINPLTFFKLYNIFLNIADQSSADRKHYMKVFALNVASYLGFFVLIIILASLK